MGQRPRTRAPLKQRAPNPGEGRQHRPSPLLRPNILPLNGANPALRMGHMAHPSEPSTRTVKAGNPWAVTDRGGHDHEKEGLCDSHPLHQSLCRGCPGGLWRKRRRYRQWRWRRSRKASRGYELRSPMLPATRPTGPSLSSPRASTPATASSPSSILTRTPTSCSTTRQSGMPALSGPRMTPSSTTARLGATLPIHTRAA